MEFIKRIEKDNVGKIVINIFAYLSSALIFLNLLVLIYEFINVWILKNIESYPWGKGEEEYWNYESPEIYTNDLLFSIILIIVAFTLDIKFRKRNFLIVVTNITLIILMSLYSQYKMTTR